MGLKAPNDGFKNAADKNGRKNGGRIKGGKRDLGHNRDLRARACGSSPCHLCRFVLGLLCRAVLESHRPVFGGSVRVGFKGVGFRI